MLRSKTILMASMVIALGATSAQAAEKRLAFSKSAGVEVFGVDNWCKTDAAVKLKAEKSFFDDKAADFVPKIGAAVLPKECAQATSMEITGVNMAGEVIYSGSASKASGWTLVDKAVLPAAAPTSAKPPTSQTSVQTTDTVPEQTLPAISPTKDFKVSGWSPSLSVVDLRVQQGIKDPEFKDQNGCLVRTPRFDATKTPGAFATTTGLSCDQGYVKGNGTALIKRSDGKVLRTMKGSFTQGYAFDTDLNAINAFPVSRYTNRYDQHLDVYFESNISLGTHYLVQYEADRSGVFKNTTVVIGLTEREADFYTEGTLKAQTEAAKHAYAVKYGTTHRLDYIAFAKYLRTTQVPAKDHWLYEVDMQQRYKGLPEVDYSDSKNHAYSRRQEALKAESVAAERAEREAKQEAERLARKHAREKQEKIDLYEAMENDHALAMRQLLIAKAIDAGNESPNIPSYDWTYDARGLMRYALELSSPDSVKMMVKIDSIDDGVAVTDWPYPMEITLGETELDTGWNVIYGELSADLEKRDDKGLLMPLIELAGGVTCESAGCEDDLDLTEIVQIRFDDPTWEYQE